MKFSVLNGELLTSLTKASRVIPVKSTMSIFENFLFSLENNDLSISATDGEMAVTSKIKVDGKENGKMVIPSKKLMEISSLLPPNIEINFDINIDTCKILIMTDQAEYRLTGQNIGEYPKLPELKEEQKIPVQSDILQRLVSKTIFCVGKDELRPALTGVFFQLKKNEIRAVATDGHRLVKIVNKNFTYDEEKELVIPNKALVVILNYFVENLNYIAVNQTHIEFIFENSVVITRLIDDKYPNYESVIPADNNYTLTANKNDLLSSVTRASIFTNNINNLVKFSIDKNVLSVSADDPEFGMSAIERIPCEFDSSKFEIGFNGKYVIDILSHLDSDEVNFLLSSPSRAVMVIPKDKSENEDILMLLMPLRLNT